ncbi:MAG TPA: hypothetical protein DCR55_01215 [Lentisphaeria bacterium]|jgi:Na+-transporting methylmalonyl-CoA/oxaloacetate decarboxylase gamma subunit|nr:hypothetical protein [Lentisphaeria bacterium]
MAAALRPTPFQLENITNADGLQIAFAGMAIVFAALIFISLFIVALPKILIVANKILPEAEPHIPVRSAKPKAADTSSAGAEIAAAVAFAYHTNQEGD